MAQIFQTSYFLLHSSFPSYIHAIILKDTARSLYYFFPFFLHCPFNFGFIFKVKGLLWTIE